MNNPLTIALQVEWLRRCLLGRLRLPSCEDMITDVKAMMRCGGAGRGAACCLAGCLAGCTNGCTNDGVAGGRATGWLPGWLTGWLAGRLD